MYKHVIDLRVRIYVAAQSWFLRPVMLSTLATSCRRFRRL